MSQQVLQPIEAQRIARGAVEYIKDAAAAIQLYKKPSHKRSDGYNYTTMGHMDSLTRILGEDTHKCQQVPLRAEMVKALNSRHTDLLWGQHGQDIESGKLTGDEQQYNPVMMMFRTTPMENGYSFGSSLYPAHRDADFRLQALTTISEKNGAVERDGQKENRLRTVASLLYLSSPGLLEYMSDELYHFWEAFEHSVTFHAPNLEALIPRYANYIFLFNLWVAQDVGQVMENYPEAPFEWKQPIFMNNFFNLRTERRDVLHRLLVTVAETMDIKRKFRTNYRTAIQEAVLQTVTTQYSMV